ncbi:MAG: hypothetical protein ACRDQU_20755, partial [Pseudonocardiaceae bacterium]
MTEITMRRVVGLDLGRGSVHVAVITRRVGGDLIAAVASFTSRVPGADRVADLTGCADRGVGDAVLVVLGLPDAGRADPLRCAVTVVLGARGVPVATVAAAELAVDVAELWPAVELATAGEATALGLAHAGGLRLG